MIFEVEVDLLNSNGKENHLKVPMKVDTGAHFSVLTSETIAKLDLPIQKHPLTREPVKVPLSVANGYGFHALMYGPVTMLIPKNKPGEEVEHRLVTADVIEGTRNILATTQLELAGASVDVNLQRLIEVPIEI